eukprot:15367198-Ditylum_brightwellii.AAC.2
MSIVKNEALKEPSSLWSKTENWTKKYKQRALFSQLKHGYEIAIGFKVAREEVLGAFKLIQSTQHNYAAIRRGLEKDVKDVRTALLDTQRLYSEIAASITTYVAARTLLNKQRHAIHGLYNEGLLEINEHKSMIGTIEFLMKRLTNHPPLIEMPKKHEILGQIPWLECVESEDLANTFEDAIFQRGDILVKQDEKSDSVHVLARGTVVVSQEIVQSQRSSDSTEIVSGDLVELVELDELGMGSVFGEMAWALKCPRGASIIATSPGLLFTISGPRLRELASSNKEIEKRLWETCGRRLTENLLALHPKYKGTSRRKAREVVHEMTLCSIDPLDKRVCFNTSGVVVLLRGTANIQNDLLGSNEVVEAPNLLENNMSDHTFAVDLSTDGLFMCNPLTIIEELQEHESDSVRQKSILAIECQQPNTSIDSIAANDMLINYHRSPSKLSSNRITVPIEQLV